jgi:hypothetical protein
MPNLAGAQQLLAALIGGTVIGAMAWQVGQLSDHLWVPLGQSTLWLVSGLLRLGTSNVIIHPSDFLIGTSAFVVQISPAAAAAGETTA